MDTKEKAEVQHATDVVNEVGLLRKLLQDCTSEEESAEDKTHRNSFWNGMQDLLWILKKEQQYNMSQM